MNFKFTHGDKTAGTKSARRIGRLALSGALNSDHVTLTPEQKQVIRELRATMDADHRNRVWELHHRAAFGVQERLKLRLKTDPVRYIHVETPDGFSREGMWQCGEDYDWSAVSVHAKNPSWRAIWVAAKRKETE